MFSKSIRVVYLYVVAFIFLMVSIFSFVTTVNNVATLVFPEPGYCYDEDYDYWNKDWGRICTPDMKNWAIRESITSGVTFVISTGLFIYHWRAIEKERGNK